MNKEEQKSTKSQEKQQLYELYQIVTQITSISIGEANRIGSLRTEPHVYGELLCDRAGIIDQREGVRL